MQNVLVRWTGWVRPNVLVIALVFIVTAQVRGEEGPAHPTVRLDLNAGSFLNPLPFDRAFLIVGRAPQDVARVSVTFEEFFDAGHFLAEQPERVATRVAWRSLRDEPPRDGDALPSDPSARWNRLEQRLQGDAVPGAEEAQGFRVVVPPLEADRAYLIRVETERRPSDESEPPSYASASFSVHTESDAYVSMDAGLLYAHEIEETSMYLGVNFYLRPVAKGVSLRSRGGFLRRCAFTAGLAVQDVEDKRSTRRALVGPMSIVLGAGIHSSNYVRLGGGALIFRERDPETFPLTTRTSLTSTPYISASFDLDVGSQLRGLGGLFDGLKGGDAE